MEFSRQEYWSGIAISFSRGSFQPRDQTRSFALQADSLSSEPPGKSKLFPNTPLMKCTPFSSVQSFSHVQLFATPWITAHQSSLSITNSQSSLKLMSIESVMPSSHLILCRPLLLLPPIAPTIRVFSSESTLCMRWPKYWSFSFNISPSNEHPGLISFRMDWLDLLSVQFSSVQSLSRVWLFATPWIAAHQASLSITNSRSPPKTMSINLVMPFNYLILSRPLLLPSSIFPTIRVFSNESALRIRWTKYWSFSFNISPSDGHPGLISLGWTGWISSQFSPFSSVTQSSPTLCDPMNCSTPGLPVHHHLPEFTLPYVK